MIGNVYRDFFARYCVDNYDYRGHWNFGEGDGVGGVHDDDENHDDVDANYDHVIVDEEGGERDIYDDDAGESVFDLPCHRGAIILSSLSS